MLRGYVITHLQRDQNTSTDVCGPLALTLRSVYEGDALSKYHRKKRATERHPRRQTPTHRQTASQPKQQDSRTETHTHTRHHTEGREGEGRLALSKGAVIAAPLLSDSYNMRHPASAIATGKPCRDGCRKQGIHPHIWLVGWVDGAGASTLRMLKGWLQGMITWWDTPRYRHNVLNPLRG